jgi:dephospho-CoA kinase
MIQTKKIVLLFGKICSGKSTYADALSYLTKAKRITVSDVVKRVSGKITRSELQQTKDFDIQIADELIKEVYLYDKVVIDGIRQHTIVGALLEHFGTKDIDMVWLEVPDNIRKFRFSDRAVAKDDISFEEADKRDEALGLLELQERLKNFYTVINN